MTEHLAHVDARAGRLFVTSYSRTPIGLWRLNGWLRILDRGAADAELGRAMSEALERSGVDEPSDEAYDDLLRAVGARSSADYHRGTRSTQVAVIRRQIGRLPFRRRFSEIVEVMPERNAGPRGGFTGLRELAVELSAPTDEELAAAVRNALIHAIPYGEEVDAEPPALETDRPAAARGFGPKSAWLAVRSVEPREVAAALGLRELRPETWEPALDAVPPLLFLTLPVDGWTLVVHGSDVGERIDLAALSRRFGEAQSFATHRVVDLQEWQRWVDGSPVRRYRWIGESGEIELDEGTPAAAEAGIARRADLDRDWDELVFPDEDVVLNVAAEWSVDPMELDRRIDLPAEGLLGRWGRR